MTKEELLQGQALHKILETAALIPLFQPIISLKKNKIYGYEALIRGPSDSGLHSPVNLFDAASRHGRLAELDLLCREVAIKHFGQLNLKQKLFINTIPAALLQSGYQHGLTLGFLEKAGIPADQVVIELTEQYPIDDYNLMRDATEHYRDMGFSIAIDDLGAGYSGLRTWSELRPDFVKLDRHFMHNIHDDAQKRQFVQSMLDIANGIDCQVIGEGIEIREEYVAAQDMKIDFVQGYYFSRPTEKPTKLIKPELFNKRRTKSIFKQIQPRANTLVSSLLTTLNPLNNNDTVNTVGDRFQQDNDLISLPVINNEGRAIGMVWRNEFMTLYASRYGRDLHGRKPIQMFMDQDPIIADMRLPLKTLSQMITSQDEHHQHSMFIITNKGQYRGVGSLMDLLRQITDIQLISARHANPLSGLPGNVPISEQTKEAIKHNHDVVVCYFDLDNFKPYNDIYGYGKGDTVISETAKILCKHMNSEIDFVGHVGGDDFIAIFSSSDWQTRCNKILADFSAIHPNLYNNEHINAGGITAINRDGNSVFYQLLSLSIGAVKLLDFDDIRNEDDLAEVASRAKSAAKKQLGNSLYQLTQ
jgi:diguanylate cyclase (GGDEF)-like protein